MPRDAQSERGLQSDLPSIGESHEAFNSLLSATPKVKAPWKRKWSYSEGSQNGVSNVKKAKTSAPCSQLPLPPPPPLALPPPPKGASLQELAELNEARKSWKAITPNRCITCGNFCDVCVNPPPQKESSSKASDSSHTATAAQQLGVAPPQPKWSNSPRHDSEKTSTAAQTPAVPKEMPSKREGTETSDPMALWGVKFTTW